MVELVTNKTQVTSPVTKKKKGIGYTRGLHHIRTIGASPNVADCVATLTLDFGLCFFSEF